ncbi:MAG TPA: CoA transferase [Acidimicrobiales bacterium]|nr:CoA transferase [Acidimicrobiales bacterium]
MTGPLAGVRVVELASVIMTPYAGQLLGDLGADVIKVEHAGMDSSRVMGGGPRVDLSGIALNLHRNKRSLFLDVKTPRGGEVFRRLLVNCDVLLTNLRPGALARLGLSYDDLSSSFPGLVYCQSQGFASDGDDADRPAYDDIIQAMVGMPWLNERVLGQTSYFPSIIGDKIAGLTITYGVLAALVHRERTGQGQKVEVPMFDAVLAFNLVEHLSGATFPGGPAGYTRIMTPHRGPHRTSDGYIAMMPYTDEHWNALFAALERDDIKQRPWFASHRERLLQADRVYRDLAELIAQRTTGEWLELCARLNIPASPVASLDDIVNDPNEHRGVLRDEVHPIVGAYRHINSPVKMSATPESTLRHAPIVAQHTQEILGELGFTDVEIDQLVAEGVAARPDDLA